MNSSELGGFVADNLAKVGVVGSNPIAHFLPAMG